MWVACRHLSTKLLSSILLLGALMVACSPSSEPMDLSDDSLAYSGDYTQAENLIADLQRSWIRRDIDKYSDLLAEDFVFVFQEDDADGIPEGFWDKADDVLAVERIFKSPHVSAIRMDLTWGAPEPGLQTLITGVEATRIIVHDTFLDVDLDGGQTTLRVDGDHQWFYFAMGDPSKGEDANRLYILEWQDLGSVRLAFVEGTRVGSIKKLINTKPAVERPTISAIKQGVGRAAQWEPPEALKPMTPPIQSRAQKTSK